MKFFDKFKTDIGIDLGTANTLFYKKNEGIIINEPTIIAVNQKTGQTLAIGNEAKKMLGRAPTHVSVIRPLVNGVISDFFMAQEILRHFIKQLKKDKFFNYLRSAIAIPTNLTEVERKSVEDAVISSGSSVVYLIEEPVAAALGAGLEIEEPSANMIIDIGGGTTEIAVISIGGIVVSRSIKIAGDKFNEDISRFIKEDFKLLIGEATAERVKIEIGSAIPMEKKSDIKISGRDVSTGLPKEISIKNSQIRIALAPSLKKMVETIKDTIENIPPELMGDILKKGIKLSGGGSLLNGLDQLIEKEIGVKTILVEDPLSCVVKGTGIAIENIDRYKNIFTTAIKPINLE